MKYRASARGLKLPEISLGLWHNFGGTAPLERLLGHAHGSVA
jgi:aryl-alcohol dehydrogenase-like predicted oxidoreductase